MYSIPLFIITLFILVLTVLIAITISVIQKMSKELYCSSWIYDSDFDNNVYMRYPNNLRNNPCPKYGYKGRCKYVDNINNIF